MQIHVNLHFFVLSYNEKTVYTYRQLYDRYGIHVF